MDPMSVCVCAYPRPYVCVFLWLCHEYLNLKNPKLVETCNVSTIQNTIHTHTHTRAQNLCTHTLVSACKNEGKIERKKETNISLCWVEQDNLLDVLLCEQFYDRTHMHMNDIRRGSIHIQCAMEMASQCIREYVVTSIVPREFTNL